MRKVVLIFTILLVIVTISACSSSSVTSTPTPTKILTPTEVPEPTATPLPTPTITPEPTLEEKIALCEKFDVADVKASPDNFMEKYMTATGELIDIVAGEDQYQFLVAENGDKTKLWELYILYSECPESFAKPEIGATLTGYGFYGGTSDWIWGEIDYTSVPEIRCFVGGIK
ncbi:MAG: hypothetical protein ACYCYM_13745 [Saccharofermentanales bacterium]